MTTIKTATEFNNDLEFELLKKYHDGDSDAIDGILELNYKFINYLISSEFSGFKQFHGDLFSEGFIGLREAVERWKEEKHDGFKSYKYFWIRKYMLQFLNKESKYVNVDEDNENGCIFDFQFIPSNQEKIADLKILLDEAMELGILTDVEGNVITDFMTGFTHKEINNRRFDGNRLSHFHFTRAKEKLLKMSKGHKMKKVNNKKVKAIESSKGRFFGLETKKGDRHNARLLGSTDHYLNLYDRNADRRFKVAKSNVKSVTLGGETY